MAETTHIIRATLQFDKTVYRDVELPSKASLEMLAKGILDAFNFDMDHAFGFYSGITPRTTMESHPKYELFADLEFDDCDAESVSKTAVSVAYPEPGAKLMFLFDYGDEWLFQTEYIGTEKKVARATYPAMIGGAGEAPEQYPEDDWDDEEE